MDKSKLDRMGRLLQKSLGLQRLSGIWEDMADNVVRLANTNPEDDFEDYELLVREIGNAITYIEEMRDSIDTALRELKKHMQPFANEI